MRTLLREKNSGGAVSLCSLNAGVQRYGIDTRKILEVLGDRAIQHVPLAPGFIGGVMSYRGEVLTVVDLRALLGLAQRIGECCVIVLGGSGSSASDDVDLERYGLVVDGVGGVVTLSQDIFAPNPATLDAVSMALFDGAFQMSDGLLVQLDPSRLAPSRLAASGLFGQTASAMADV
jgi:purine-binding chemotaxis protein CheW